MDSQTCTAAVVTPYPSPASQAQSRADSCPQSSRRPSPHPPQPPSLAQSCLSRASPAVHLPFTTQTLVKRSRTLINTHQYRPAPITAHHSPSPESRQLQLTQSHPNSRQTLTNAHTTLMNTHPCRPALITAHHPNHSPCSSRKRSCNAHIRSRTLVNAHATLTNTREHSRTLADAHATLTNTREHSRTLANAHATLTNTHEHS